MDAYGRTPKENAMVSAHVGMFHSSIGRIIDISCSETFGFDEQSIKLLKSLGHQSISVMDGSPADNLVQHLREVELVHPSALSDIDAVMMMGSVHEEDLR